MNAVIRWSAVGALLMSASAMAQQYTPPGTKLAVGESAIVPFHVPYQTDIPAKVTVTAIDAGTQADLAQAGFKLSPDQQNLKPYYARFTVTLMANGTNLAGSSLNGILGVDDRHQTHIMAIANSNFTGARLNKCNADGAFKASDGAGSSYSTCELYMIDQSGAIVALAFKGSSDKVAGQPYYFSDPVVWTAGAAPTQAQPEGQGTVITH